MTDLTETDMAERIDQNVDDEVPRDLDRNNAGWCQALTADEQKRTELTKFPYHNRDMPTRSMASDALISSSGNESGGMAVSKNIVVNLSAPMSVETNSLVQGRKFATI